MKVSPIKMFVPIRMHRQRDVNHRGIQSNLLLVDDMIRLQLSRKSNTSDRRNAEYMQFVLQ